MTVAELFDQYLLACYPEGVDEAAKKKLQHSFYSGAKCIIAIAGEALTPNYPGAKHNVKGMLMDLARVDQETTLYIRNPDPPEEEEKLIEVPEMIVRLQ